MPADGPNEGAPPTERTAFASGSLIVLGAALAPDSTAPPAKSTASVAPIRPSEEIVAQRVSRVCCGRIRARSRLRREGTVRRPANLDGANSDGASVVTVWR